VGQPKGQLLTSCSGDQEASWESLIVRDLETMVSEGPEVAVTCIIDHFLATCLRTGQAVLFTVRGNIAMARVLMNCLLALLKSCFD